MTEQEQETLTEEVNTEAQEESAAQAEANPAEAAEEPAAEAADESAKEAAEEAVEQDAEALAGQLAELNQRFLRVAADFENYKRRTALEKDDLLKYSNAKLIGELLPVLDTFQLALKNSGNGPEVQNVVKGMEMIYRQMLQVLEQAGMSKIEAVGQPFDPKLHEAVMQVEDDSVPEDTVVEELRAGYMLKERVIRPSMVKVSK